MPIDPSIALSVRAPQASNPLEEYAKALSLKDLMRQGQLQDQQVQRQEQVRQAFRESQGRVTPELIAKLREIDPAAAFAIEKQMGDASRDAAATDKLDAETQGLKLTNQVKKARRFAEILDSVKDEASKDQAIRSAVEAGVVDKKTAAEWFFFPYDETTKAEIERMKSESLTIAEKTEAQIKAAEEARKAALFPSQKTKAEADAQAAQQAASGTQPITPYQRAQLDAQDARQKSQQAFQEQLATKRDAAAMNRTQILSGATAGRRASMDANYLGRSFDDKPIVKDFNTMQSNLYSIKSFVESGWSGPGDMAVIFNYMKALDPNSVVRETEYANAAKAGNIFAGWAAKFNGMLNPSGGFLSQQVKQDFLKTLGKQFEVKTQQYRNLRKETARKIEEAAGVDNGEKFLTDYEGAFPSLGQGGGISVTAPNGQVYTFPDQEKADAFKKAAGIK